MKRAFHESGQIVERLKRLRLTYGEAQPTTEQFTEDAIVKMPAGADGRSRSTPLGTDMIYQNISYHTPPLKRFSGKVSEYQLIVDFIEVTERQAHLECHNEEVARVKLLMSLLRTNLKGPAREFLNTLMPTEKEDWGKLKETYIYKFKTERDVRAKQRAKEQCASFKQKPEETLKAYGERAMKLRQLIEANDEAFLVHRFLKGIRDKSVRQILAVGPEDMAKVTVAHLNTKIGHLIRAGEESDASDIESGDSSDEDTDDSDSEGQSSRNKRKKKKAKEKKESKELKKAMKIIGSLEERLKKMEAGGHTDTFAAQAVYNPNVANYRRQVGANEGAPRAPSNPQYGNGGQQNSLPESYVCCIQLWESGTSI